MDVPSGVLALCPYGHPGEQLWVKETTYNVEDSGWVGPVYVESDEGRQAAEWGYGEYDDPDFIEPYDLKKRSSLFMTRAMSRVLLEIVSVRVERLQNLSEADAIAEGLFQDKAGRWTTWSATEAHREHLNPIEAYRELWESINGCGSWAANPWVWVISFRRIDAAGGAA